ncbi:MAG TPA: sigma-70 family RNA polymerase sigma factor [Chryseosolibacter sp.]|nr:sigma-70 family RNA polymerase sigma factor [Chryseosolibacter sp.]
MKVSDQDLIHQLLSNDPATAEKAWQHVYKRYYPSIKALVLKLRGADQDAIDIFQDTLVIFHRNIRAGAFKGGATLKTYIYSIARNLWLRQYQKMQKNAGVEAVAYETATEDLDYIRNADIVSALMDQLKDDCKKILIEYYYNNRSMAELQEIFTLSSIQAAKNKKWRCLGYLVKLLKEKTEHDVKMLET